MGSPTAAHYLNLTAEGGAPGVQLGEAWAGGSQYYLDAQLAGPHVGIVPASVAGFSFASRLNVFRFALNAGDPQTTPPNGRFMASIAANDPTEGLSPFDVYYVPGGLGTKPYGWHYHGQDYYHVTAAMVPDHAMDPRDDPRGGWDSTVGQPFIRLKFYEPYHTDKYIDGAVSGFTYHGHNNHGLSTAWQLSSNPASNPQFVQRPDGHSLQSTVWQNQGFCPALTDPTPYWSVNWGGGDVTLNNNTFTWAGRPIIPNQWIFFIYRLQVQDYDGVLDTTPGHVQVWMLTAAELATLTTSTPPLIDYTGSTNAYVAGMNAFDPANPDAVAGQPSALRMMQRPGFLLPGMAYYPNAAITNLFAPGLIYESGAERFTSLPAAVNSLNPTAPAVAPSIITIPTLSGVAQVLQPLTATPGPATGTLPITPTYQWQKATSEGTPTQFGKTTNGIGKGTVPTGYVIGSRWVLGEQAVASKMSIKLTGLGSGSQVYRCEIYKADDTDGNMGPGTLVAVTDEITCPNDANEFMDLPFDAPVDLAPGQYFLCFWAGNTTDQSQVDYDLSADAHGSFYKFVSSYASTGNPPSIAGYSYESFGWAVNVTYTPASGTPSDISGQTALVYTPVSGDIGYILRMSQTDTNSAGADTVESAWSAPVIDVPPPPPPTGGGGTGGTGTGTGSGDAGTGGTNPPAGGGVTPPPATPVVNDTFAQTLSVNLAPMLQADPANGYSLSAYLGAIGTMFQPVEDYGRFDPVSKYPGWAKAMDINMCADETIPWLGQFIGVQLPSGMTAAQQRLYVATAPRWSRGTPLSMVTAGQLLLSGTQTVILRERLGGDAWAVEYLTKTKETPLGDIGTTNLIANGSFETNTTGWSVFNGGSPTFIRDQVVPPVYGAYVGHLTFDGVNTQQGIVYDTGNTITPSEVYTFSLWTYLGNSVQNDINILVREINAGATVVADHNLTRSYLQGVGWQQSVITITTDPTTIRLQVGVYQLGSAAAQQILLDGAQLEQRSIATAFVPTDGAPETRAPGLGAMGSAVIAQKPGGIIITFNTIDGQDFQHLLDNHALFSNVFADYATFQGVITDVPGS